MDNICILGDVILHVIAWPGGLRDATDDRFVSGIPLPTHFFPVRVTYTLIS